MSNYSKKQKLFAIYLLNQFGITDDNFIETFLNNYAYAYGSYQDYPSGRYFVVSESITQLILEKEIRKNKFQIIKKNLNFNSINATEIANYVFCQASYVVAKTFEIQYPTSEKQRIIGIDLHEKLSLIGKFNDYKKSSLGYVFDNTELKKILNSKIVHHSHNLQTERKIFFNNENKIACDPDYILLDSENNHFIVEEKFHYKKDPTIDKEYYLKGYSAEFVDEAEYSSEEWKNLKTIFYKNHQIQLLVYLKNITEYKLVYGYLIYWHYDFKSTEPYINKEPYIHKVSIKKIILNDYYNEFYRNTLNDFFQLLTNKVQKFDINKVNPNKCSSCVVNKYCGHKNKKFDELKFPYDLEYMKFHKAEYPEELKKPMS